MNNNISKLAERIRQGMFDKDIRTISELERRADVGKDTVRNLLAGRTTSIRNDKLEPIATALEMTVEELNGATVVVGSKGTNGFIKAKRLLNEEIDRYGEFVIFPVSVIDTQDTGSYASLRMSGDSMAPMLKDGNELLVDTDQTNILDGQLYALSMNGTVVVRKLYVTPNNIQLRCLNPEYPQLDIKREDISGIEIKGRIMARVGKVP